MKSDVNGCSTTAPGTEQYEKFKPFGRGKHYYQYDYRKRSGELFSTVAPSLEVCRKRRDKWLQEA